MTPRTLPRARRSVAPLLALALGLAACATGQRLPAAVEAEPPSTTTAPPATTFTCPADQQEAAGVTPKSYEPDGRFPPAG